VLGVGVGKGSSGSGDGETVRVGVEVGKVLRRDRADAGSMTRRCVMSRRQIRPGEESEV
jgi:hypothetical protein